MGVQVSPRAPTEIAQLQAYRGPVRRGASIVPVIVPIEPSRNAFPRRWSFG
jgi:hypothetical protein